MKILTALILFWELVLPGNLYVVPRYRVEVSNILARLDSCSPETAQMIRENVFYVGHSDLSYSVEFLGNVFLVDEPNEELAFVYFVHESRHAWQIHHPEYWLDWIRYNSDMFAHWRIELDAVNYGVKIRARCYGD